MIFAVLEDWYHHIVLTHSCKLVSFLHITNKSSTFYILHLYYINSDWANRWVYFLQHNYGIVCWRCMYIIYVFIYCIRSICCVALCCEVFMTSLAISGHCQHEWYFYQLKMLCTCSSRRHCIVDNQQSNNKRWTPADWNTDDRGLITGAALLLASPSQYILIIGILLLRANFDQVTYFRSVVFWLIPFAVIYFAPL